MNASLENFSEKSLRALSSRNLTCEGVKSEEDAPKRRGFRDEADFHLGAIEQLTREREREREREACRKVQNTYQYLKKISKGTYE